MKRVQSMMSSFVLIPAVSGGLVFFAVRLLRAQTSNVAWTPATVRIQETSANVNDGSVFGRLTFIAVRSDGSRASGDASPDRDPRHFGVRTVVSISAGTTTVVNDVQRSKTTTFMDTPRDTTCLQPHVAAGAKYLVKGPGEILFGSRTIVIEYDNDDVLTRRWESPDLNCLAIRQTDEFHDKNEKTFSRLEREPVEVEKGEPDVRFFNIPVDDVERLPSEMRLETANQRGAKVSDRMLTRYRALDQSYLDNVRHAQASGRYVPQDVLDILHRNSQ